MTDMLIILVLIVILGAALSYMRKEKSKGVNCIGCPDAAVCEMRKRGFSCQENEPKI